MGAYEFRLFHFIYYLRNYYFFMNTLVFISSLFGCLIAFLVIELVKYFALKRQGKKLQELFKKAEESFERWEPEMGRRKDGYN